MARAAAARSSRSGTSHSRADARKRPARRASGRTGAHRSKAQRNAAALKRSAAAKKAAATRKANAQQRRSRRPAPRPRVAAGGGAGALTLPLPIRVARAPFTRSLRARGGGVLDALLSGQGWIALVFVLLAGIVFFNVDLLKLNRDIAATAQKSSAVARENSRLRVELAKLDSSERIQTAAAQRGLLLPAPGKVRYLTANPTTDARRAAKLVEAPDAAAVAPAPVPQAAAPVAPAPVAPAPVATEPPQPAPAGGAATTAAPAG